MGVAGDFGARQAEDDERACGLAETALDTEWTGEATDALAEHLGRRPTREEIAEARIAYASRVTELLDIMHATAVRQDFLDTLDERASREEDARMSDNICVGDWVVAGRGDDLDIGRIVSLECGKDEMIDGDAIGG